MSIQVNFSISSSHRYDDLQRNEFSTRLTILDDDSLAWSRERLDTLITVKPLLDMVYILLGRLVGGKDCSLFSPTTCCLAISNLKVRQQWGFHLNSNFISLCLENAIYGVFSNSLGIHNQVETTHTKASHISLEVCISLIPGAQNIYSCRVSSFKPHLFFKKKILAGIEDNNFPNDNFLTPWLSLTTISLPFIAPCSSKYFLA